MLKRKESEMRGWSLTASGKNSGADGQQNLFMHKKPLPLRSEMSELHGQR